MDDNLLGRNIKHLRIIHGETLDTLAIEHRKADRTTDIQALLELCGIKAVDNRTVSPELQSMIKQLCIAHGIQFDSIPTKLEDGRVS